MKHSARYIVEITLKGIILYFKDSTIAQSFPSRQQHEQLISKLESILFVSFNEFYTNVEKFLLQNSLSDKNSTIIAFAQTLPDYHLFSKGLQYSLTFHDAIWNKVYENLVVAQIALK